MKTGPGFEGAPEPRRCQASLFIPTPSQVIQASPDLYL